MKILVAYLFDSMLHKCWLCAVFLLCPSGMVSRRDLLWNRLTLQQYSASQATSSQRSQGVYILWPLRLPGVHFKRTRMGQRWLQRLAMNYTALLVTHNHQQNESKSTELNPIESKWGISASVQCSLGVDNALYICARELHKGPLCWYITWNELQRRCQERLVSFCIHIPHPAGKASGQGGWRIRKSGALMLGPFQRNVG